MNKLQYMIINESVYRKLEPGEYFYYRHELHRLKKLKNEIWLKLNDDDSKQMIKNFNL